MKHISVAEARKNFAHVINEVTYGGQRYTVQRRGRPLVTLVSAAHYQALIGLLSESGAPSEIRGMPVHIHFDGQRFSVSDDRFQLRGQGLTLGQAQSDFWLAVREYYAKLQRDELQLPSHVAADHLELLERILVAAHDEAE